MKTFNIQINLFIRLLISAHVTFELFQWIVIDYVIREEPMRMKLL